MTDDQTQYHDPARPADPAATPAEPAAAPGDPGATPAGEQPAAPAGAVETADAAAVPVAPVAAGASKARWFVALGVVAVVVLAAVAAMLLFGKASAPEALTYIPGDAALVVELRPELPGDQLQALGNLLAHFPGFEDQSTLPQKIDEALKRLIAQAPGSSIDYEKDIKPLLSGPMFLAARSLDDMAVSGEPANWVLVATTTGTVTCDTTFQGQQLTTESYNGLTLSVSADQQMACAIDAKFLLAGDPAGVKNAIDTHKAAGGLDKSTRYQAARAQLGGDRLATMFFDGAAFAKAIPSAEPAPALGEIASVIPDWIMAGLRAENDALVVDTVIAPPANPAAAPSTRPVPPAHPISFTAFAPAQTLVFAEAQGAGVSILNVLDQLKSDPQFAEALQGLDTFGGLDGLVGWVDDAGFVVFRDGEAAAGGILLAAKDAATASQKVTALETVLALGALGGDMDVSTTTIEGIKVTTIHIPDAGALAGQSLGGAAIPVDLSIAAKDKYVIVGVGATAMQQLLGVKAGSGLADDAAFKRALARGQANPQVVVYVAAGATIDWLDAAGAALGTPPLPADVKAYLDPIEGFIYTTVGDGLHGGSLRFAITVANR